MCMDASKLQNQCTNTPSTNIFPPQPSTDLLLFLIHHLFLTQNIDVGKAGWVHLQITATAIAHLVFKFHLLKPCTNEDLSRINNACMRILHNWDMHIAKQVIWGKYGEESRVIWWITQLYILWKATWSNYSSRCVFVFHNLHNFTMCI